MPGLRCAKGNGKVSKCGRGGFASWSFACQNREDLRRSELIRGGLALLIPLSLCVIILGEGLLRAFPLWLAAPPWSRAAVGRKLPSPFRPSVSDRAEALRGDLSHMANVEPSELIGPIEFSSDEHGFRSTHSTLGGDPEIVVAGGRSFGFGALLSNRDAFPAALERHTGVRCASVSTAFDTDLDTLENILDGFQTPPAIVIYIILDVDSRDAAHESPPRRGKITKALESVGLRETQIEQGRRLRMALGDLKTTLSDTSPMYALGRRVNRHLAAAHPSQSETPVGVRYLRDGRRTLILKEQEIAAASRDEQRIHRNAEWASLFASRMRSRGIRPMVLVLPTKFSALAPFLTDSPVVDPAYFHRVIASSLKSRDVPFVDPLATIHWMLRSNHPVPELYFHDDTHWSPEGADLVASLVAGALCSSGIRATHAIQ